jgi:hypothetical protein
MKAAKKRYTFLRRLLSPVSSKRGATVGLLSMRAAKRNAISFYKRSLSPVSSKRGATLI